MPELEDRAVRMPNASAMLFKKLLVPVDFSPLSERAFHHAVRLARQFKSELIVMHVLEPVVPVAFEGLAMAPPDSTEEIAAANKGIRAMLASARTAGIAKIK